MELLGFVVGQYDNKCGTMDGNASQVDYLFYVCLTEWSNVVV